MASNLTEQLLGLPEALDKYFTGLSAEGEIPDAPETPTVTLSDLAEAAAPIFSEAAESTNKDLNKGVDILKLGGACIKFGATPPFWAACWKRYIKRETSKELKPPEIDEKP